jgi:hypothetical protein
MDRPFPSSPDLPVGAVIGPERYALDHRSPSGDATMTRILGISGRLMVSRAHRAASSLCRHAW